MVNHPNRKLTPKTMHVLGTFTRFDRPINAYEIVLFGPSSVPGGIMAKIEMLVGYGLLDHDGPIGTYAINDAGRAALGLESK